MNTVIFDYAKELPMFFFVLKKNIGKRLHTLSGGFTSIRINENSIIYIQSRVMVLDFIFEKRILLYTYIEYYIILTIIPI